MVLENWDTCWTPSILKWMSALYCHCSVSFSANSSLACWTETGHCIYDFVQQGELWTAAKDRHILMGSTNAKTICNLPRPDVCVCVCIWILSSAEIWATIRSAPCTTTPSPTWASSPLCKNTHTHSQSRGHKIRSFRIELCLFVFSMKWYVNKTSVGLKVKCEDLLPLWYMSIAVWLPAHQVSCRDIVLL